MELVFRALADPTRRLLLDRLHASDGQTLAGLCAAMEQTRYGVMKHLRVLEEAGLVVRRRDGRTVRHYLNPIPIQEMYDRWIDKYRAPWARGLVTLKRELEDAMEANRHVYQLYIRASIEEVWRAITDPAMTARYFFGTSVRSEWTPGASMRYEMPDGRVVVSGEVVEIEAPRRLVTTWQAHWNADGTTWEPTKVTWELEQAGDACKLTMIHSGFQPNSKAYTETAGGWPAILSSMKTLLETGEPLMVAV